MGKPSTLAMVAAPFTGGLSLIADQAVQGLSKTTPPKPPDAASPDKNPLPAAPSVDNADTQARMAAAQANERNRRKRTATILTSAQGVLNQAPVATKTLFGQ